MRERDLVWNKLEKARRKFNRTSILEQFQQDPQRHDVFSFRLTNLFVDLSKNLIDQQVLKDLQEYQEIFQGRVSMQEKRISLELVFKMNGLHFS